ncbi:MAG: nitrate/nitrite transporter NrtS [Actinomycetota bacterium]|nr:nitrate/nitrite transporter NrtS [Actinomycetota bacterium]
MAAGQPVGDDRPAGPDAASSSLDRVDGPPSWRTASEAVAVCLRRPNRRRIGLIAAVVGTLLAGANQGAALASGHVSWLVWVRVALDYVVPTCVSTMGVLAGTRHSTPNRL